METHITVKGALAALNAVKEATKDNVVEADVFSKRASICFKCPKRGKVSGVSKVGQFLARLAVKHQVPRSMQNQMCRVCGCPLELLLASLPENLHKDSPEEAKKRPATCWMKELDSPPNIT